MTRNTHITIIVVIILEILLITYVALNFSGQSEPFYNKDKIVSFNDGWIMKMGNSTVYKVDQMPFSAPSSAGTVVVLENNIPREYSGKSLYFMSTSKSVEVFLDGQCVYEFGIEEKRSFGKSPGNNINLINIPSTLKERHIEIVSVSPIANEASVVNTFKIADRDIAILDIIVENMFGFFSGVLLLTMGLVFFVCGIMSLRANKVTQGQFSIALCCNMTAVYLILQSQIIRIVFNNALLFLEIEYVFFTSLPCILILYYKIGLLKAYATKLNYAFALSVFNIVIQNVLNIAGYAELADMLYYTYGVFLIGIVMIIIFLFDNSRKLNRKKDSYAHLFALFFLLTGAVLDGFRVIYQNHDDITRYSKIGTIIYAIIVLFVNVVQLVRSYTERTTENANLLEREIKQIENQNRALRKAKNEAEEAKQDAIRANAAKDNFLARISHEIRTPINAVLGMDNMILRETEDETIRSYALDIRSAGRTLLSLINDILDFSKIESGNIEIIPVEYDIGSMIHDILNMIIPRAKTKGLEVILNIDENMPSRLYGDDVRIRQIITNILTNAVKYTHEGSVTFSMSAMENGDSWMVHVDVTDTGIGIKEEDLENITVAFKRIEESRNRNIEGTGLGMNITVQFLKMMGSEIQIKSEYGKGSSFFFDLKQGKVNCQPLGNIQERFAAEAEHFEEKTTIYAPEASVLVVDDNEMNRKVFRGLLKHTGVKVTDAESGKECLEIIKNDKFDIIYMDHMMPELDGIETFEIMKNTDHMCKETPVMILTANAVVGAKEMYLEKGFNDFLSKPIIPEKLEENLRKYLPEEKISDIEKSTSDTPKINIEDLPQIEGIDWTVAMLHFTDIGFLLETVDNMRITLENNISQIEELSKNVENPEVLDEYRIKVHAMKSSLAVIGASTHSGLARLLEYGAKDGDIELINSLNPYFIRECRQLRKHLEENKSEDEDKAEADSELLKTLFVQLKKKVVELDLDGMDDVMGEIAKYNIPRCEDIISGLQVDISNIDMEQIIAKSDKIIEILGGKEDK